MAMTDLRLRDDIVVPLAVGGTGRAALPPGSCGDGRFRPSRSLQYGTTPSDVRGTPRPPRNMVGTIWGQVSYGFHVGQVGGVPNMDAF